MSEDPQPSTAVNDTVCIKCGNLSANTEYRAVGYCLHNSSDLAAGVEPNERFHHECWRCGWAWDDAVTDGAPRPHQYDRNFTPAAEVVAQAVAAQGGVWDANRAATALRDAAWTMHQDTELAGRALAGLTAAGVLASVGDGTYRATPSDSESSA
jgi:predicted nucleic-acid-binding Zn-ribbon protein